MSQEHPAGYPTMPAYGEGVTSAALPTSRRNPGDARRAWPSVVLAVLDKLVLLVGVLAFGWAPGTVFVVLWGGLVVLGLATLVRVATASGRTPRTARGSRLGPAAFFCFHYGLFAVVLAVFSAGLAFGAGWHPTVVSLGLPLGLVVVRSGVELATTWFGAEGLARRTSPYAAMFEPYPRMAIVFVAVLVSSLLGLFGGMSSLSGSPWAWLRRLLAAIPPSTSPVVLGVTVLLVVAAVVDALTTRKTLVPR